MIRGKPENIYRMEESMKKNIFKLMALFVVLIISSSVLFACKPAEQAIIQKHAIPDDLAVSIEIYEGFVDSANLKGTITKADLLLVEQENVTVTSIKNEVSTTRIYVAYSVADLISLLEITLPAITGVKAIGTDDWATDYAITSFANSYITIGFEEDGAFVADKDDMQVYQAPRFLSDKDSTSSRATAKVIAKIVINPLPEV